MSNHALYPFAPAGSGHVRDFDTVEIRLDQENFDTVADYYGTCLKSEAIEPNGDAAFHELMEKVHKSFKNLDEVTKIPQKSGPDIVNPVVDSKEFVPHTYSSRVADALTNLSPYGIFAFFKYEVVPSFRNPVSSPSRLLFLRLSLSRDRSFDGHVTQNFTDLFLLLLLNITE